MKFWWKCLIIHRYALRYVYQELRRKALPVFTIWETFWFDFDEQKLI
jgi:hypothetical protein